MTGRWFQVRVKSPGRRRSATFTYLAHPHQHPDGQTAEEVRAIYAELYPAPGTRIEVTPEEGW